MDPRSRDLSHALDEIIQRTPIIPFESLPLGVQIFLVLTSVFILIGCGHIAWKMISTVRDKKD